MSDEKKVRVPKTKTPLEAELHAAKRVSDMLRGPRTEQRLRVIALVHEHLAQEVNAPSTPPVDPRQLPLPSADQAQL